MESAIIIIIIVHFRTPQVCMYVWLNYVYYTLVKIIGSTCASLGLEGCCDDFPGTECRTQSCYCDRVCHSARDCCDDIIDVGCFNSEY